MEAITKESPDKDALSKVAASSIDFFKKEKQKYYKLKYKINLLPQIGIHIIKDQKGKDTLINE